ncbi:radial spoke head protein 3 homolog isoform X2 [Falco rusticolus]|uniref:radial spoke head protein 3 homolog isoform X2 n=1 Tax=Falco rusticolus TaxID=120794 RepID=UPI001886A6D4|nr:radial spoke head protein 3 homolog isoform X2 [Falco rusticolus]
MLPARQLEVAAAPAVLYSYCSRPRALPARPKYRAPPDAAEPEKEPLRYANLMYDRRVVRGNTYSLQVKPVSTQPNPLEIQRQREARERALARKRAKEQMQPRTPEPVEGREHIHVQTELYLEEISDRIVEVDTECQTDAFLDRPPTPLFIPAKTGKDVATQIEEGEERRKRQHMQMLQKQKETTEKIAARAFAQRYLADLIPSVFNNLRDSGFFYDPIERDIETEFLPWLMTEVEETLEKKVLGRTVLDSLIRTVVEKRLDAFSHKPLSDETEAPAEELRPADAAPQADSETDAADQLVAEKEGGDQPVADEHPSRHVSFQLEESDQAGTGDLETE